MQKLTAACEAEVNMKKEQDREDEEYSRNKKKKENEQETEKREHKTTGKEKRAEINTTNDMVLITTQKVK